MLRKRLQGIIVESCNTETTAERILDKLTDEQIAGTLETAWEDILQTQDASSLVLKETESKEIRPTAGSVFLNTELKLYTQDEIRELVDTNQISIDEIYTYHSNGEGNWLERGYHIADVLGYVVMSEQIDLPDDEKEE